MKKSSFSLLELILFLVFLTLISSSLLFALPKMGKTFLAKQETKKLKGLLQSAQDWVLFSSHDLTLSLHFDKGHLILDIFPEASDLKLPFAMKSSFSTFQSISFSDPSNQSISKVIHADQRMSFLSFGLSENGGIQEPFDLVLKQRDDRSSSFYIPGYPYVLKQKK